jgi:hypothetical protein
VTQSSKLPTKTETDRISQYPNLTSKGRPKGSKNKVNTALKEAILLAAESVGEDKKGKGGLIGYLRNVAISEPRAFCGLLGKILSTEVGMDPDKPVVGNITVRFIPPDHFDN